jgi:hypothetical protein
LNEEAMASLIDDFFKVKNHKLLAGLCSRKNNENQNQKEN